MRLKTVLFSLLLVVAFIGFVSVGITHAALDFADWSGTWFAVNVSLTGKAAPVVPPSNIVTSNETATAYLLVETSAPPGYDVVYCTFDGSVWTRHTGLEWLVVGEPENFLAFFNFPYSDHLRNRGGEYWIALNVKGKENPNMVGAINSASFKSFSGVFVEERGDTGEGAMGSVKFTGKFIKPSQVVDMVPTGCRIPIVY